MNNQNPLLPQGSVAEQKNKNRARVKIAVFFVLAIHGIGLLALLMQGCGGGHDSTTAQKDTYPTNTPPEFQPANPVVMDQTNVPPQVEMTNTPPAVTAVAGATDYTVVAKDTFGKIATKFHLPLKAIMDANPGVEPAKLQIGQKIHIPPAPVASTAATGSSPAPAAPASGEQVYTVKSGDSLTKIAGEHSTTVKALRTANNLKTDNIKVGQKLKLPVRAATTAAATTAAPTEVVATTSSMH